jgi:hypothetical protein
MEGGLMKEIPLTQGKFAIVDDDDYEKLMQHKWQAQKDKNTFYANRTIRVNGKRTALSMHREILGLKKGDGKLSDHRNRNGLDNRKENLRVVILSVNNHNRKKNKNNTSGYRGVCWNKDRWYVNIGIGGGKISVGYFDDLIIAAKAYDKAVTQYRGKDAILNFPRKESESEII